MGISSRVAAPSIVYFKKQDWFLAKKYGSLTQDVVVPVKK
jgi:hypothetical protein